MFVIEKRERRIDLHWFIRNVLVRVTFQSRFIRFLTLEWTLPGAPIFHYLHWCGYEKLDLSGAFAENKAHSFTVYILGLEVFFTTEGDYFEKRLVKNQGEHHAVSISSRN